METSTPSRVGVGVVVTVIVADAETVEPGAETQRTFIIFGFVAAAAAAAAAAFAVPSSSFFGTLVGDRLLPSSPFMLLLRDTITSDVAESGP